MAFADVQFRTLSRQSEENSQDLKLVSVLALNLKSLSHYLCD